MSRPEITARLLATYLTELEEQVPLMNEELLRLEASPDDPAPLDSLFRMAHALKGASRAVQMEVVEGVCHALETVLHGLSDGSLEVTAGDLTLLYDAVDALEESARQLRSGRTPDRARAAAVVASLAERARRPGSLPATPSGTPPDVAVDTPGRPESGTTGASPTPHVRVDAKRLDELTSATTRLELWRGSASEEQARLEDLQASVTRLEGAWRLVRRELRRSDRPGERRPPGQEAETVEGELHRLRDRLEGLEAWRSRAARAATQAVHDVSRSTRQLRMRPFSEACEGLPRAARDLAAAAGKAVRLEVLGGEVEADRAVLDGLRDAVLQLVRNAIDHGIEDPATRARKGKPKAGCVRVAAALEGERLSVSVSDDGAGLDLSAVRSALRSRGRPVPERDDELARAIFEAGVSTRPVVTQISGRGVGLDVVRHAAERMRGSTDVSWEPGRGATFTITCPPTLTMFRAVTASVGGHLLAVQTSFVDRVLRVRESDLRVAEGRRMLTGRGNEEPVPVVSVSRLLPPLQESPRDPRPLLVLRDGERRLAVAVDEVLSEQEIVLRPFDELLAHPRLVSGAALLGPQRVALVLSPARIIEEGWRAGPDTEPGRTRGSKRELPRILVVDDSITTRTLEQSILAAAGYRVRVAVDGADAWRMLREEGADLVVADVEMPRMNGFELCEAIRGSTRYRELPVVLVTALDSTEHRSRGLEAGANAYIVKSGFDQQGLLDTVRQLLG